MSVCYRITNGGHEVSSLTYEQRSLNKCLNIITWLMVNMRYHLQNISGGQWISVWMLSHVKWLTWCITPKIWAEVSEWLSVCYHMTNDEHEVPSLSYEQRSVDECLYFVTWLWTWGITPNIWAEVSVWVSVCYHMCNGWYELSLLTYEQRSVNECLYVVTWL